MCKCVKLSTFLYLPRYEKSKVTFITHRKVRNKICRQSFTMHHTKHKISLKEFIRDESSPSYSIE